jgi:hypothetical protein
LVNNLASQSWCALLYEALTLFTSNWKGRFVPDCRLTLKIAYDACLSMCSLSRRGDSGFVCLVIAHISIGNEIESPFGIDIWQIEGAI